MKRFHQIISSYSHKPSFKNKYFKSYFSRTRNNYVNNQARRNWECCRVSILLPTNKQSFINAFLCVVFFCFNLSFKVFKILELLVSPAEHYFQLKYWLVQLCDFIRDFISLSRKNDATALNNYQQTTITSLNNFK